MKAFCPFKALLLLLVCVSFTAIAYGAGVPNSLNYQGTLTDSAGKPVTALAKAITFSLYTSALGGTAFWTEEQVVPVSSGQFSAVLGSTSTNPLPTDKFTGETYVGVTVDNGAEMLPRQKMTSVAYALKAADAIPKGVIVMWSGAENQIPDGWALCDGLNGTPNLRDRFVIGAGSTYPVAETGGESTHVLTTNEIPSHTHTQNTHTHTQNAHTHTQNAHTHIQDAHNHNLNMSNEDGGSASYQGRTATGSIDLWLGDTSVSATNQNTIAINQNTTAINQNTTAINQNTGGNLAHNNLPPYYALAFIMKI